MKEGSKEFHEKIVYPVCRVRTDRAGGSGTVVYSNPLPDNPEEWETYILTNFHVIEDAISIRKEWSPLKGRKVPKEYRKTVNVEFFEYKYLSDCVGGLSVEADIECWDKDEDLALLRTRTIKPASYVAELYPKEEDNKIKLGYGSYACGCSLGHTPLHTTGEIVSKVDEIENKKYWMSTAQTIFGNSGGAMFLRDGRFIGVPARITALKLGFGVDIITHMGFFIPIERIYDFLEEQMYQFIYDNEYTSTQCKDMRDKRRREEDKKLIIEEKEEEEE